MTHNIRASKLNPFNRVSTMFVFLLVAAYADQVHASCNISDRIKHGDADCLSASWNNNHNWLNHGKWKIKSECSNYGRVVAKIDIKDTWDETITLYNDSWKKGDTDLYNINYIYCCADLSDLCNKSDLGIED